MFDTTIELVGASVGTIEVESGQEGVLELVFVSGLTFPIEGPDGNPLRVPNGSYRFRLTRSQALEYFKQVSETAEALPEGSNLVVPTNAAEAERLTEQAEKIADATEGMKNG